MKYTLKTSQGSYTLTFNMTFLRLVQGYTQKDLQAFLNLSLEAINQISGSENTLLALGNLSGNMIQIVRAGIEATRRSAGDSEPVDELEAENILNSIGESPVAQMEQWGGIIAEMVQSLFPSELGKGDQKQKKSEAGKRKPASAK